MYSEFQLPSTHKHEMQDVKCFVDLLACGGLYFPHFSVLKYAYCSKEVFPDMHTIMSKVLVFVAVARFGTLVSSTLLLGLLFAADCYSVLLYIAVRAFVLTIK